MLISRKEEQNILKTAIISDESQFIAIYGRRRVGKTYLVRETFNNRFTFQHSGMAKGNARQQLQAFSDSLEEAGVDGFDKPEDWIEAFKLLKQLVRSSKDVKKILFIDELSWMDSPRSDLMAALEKFQETCESYAE